MNTVIDITKLDLKELKAMGYDAQNEISRNQFNLKVINDEIQKRAVPPTTEPVTGTEPHIIDVVAESATAS